MIPVQITSFRVDERPCEGGDEDCVPFLRVNLTFRVNNEGEEYIHERYKAASEKYKRVFSIANPEKHDKEVINSFTRKSNFREALRIVPKIFSFWSSTLTSQETGIWSRSYKGDFWRSLNWGWLEDPNNSELSQFNLEAQEDVCDLVGYTHSFDGKLNEEPSFTWTYADPFLIYLERFNTFWYRECISDCGVTRAVLSEINHYKDTQQLKDHYRFTDGSIILRHIETLNRYWD